MKTFDHLFILGRPASGKSELLDFMTQLTDADRAARFHLGKMRVMDDFIWLWEKFLEDDLWEKVTGKRLYSERLSQGYMNSPEIFDFLIEKLNREIQHHDLGNESFYGDHTLLIEFARGGECSYADALARFSPEILPSSAILYIDVRGEESQRRNEARYQEKLKHTVLAHKCPDEVMDRYYREDDWHVLTEGKQAGLLELSGVKVPFVTMNNEPESVDPTVLGPRYGEALDTLWQLLNTASA